MAGVAAMAVAPVRYLHKCTEAAKGSREHQQQKSPIESRDSFIVGRNLFMSSAATMKLTARFFRVNPKELYQAKCGVPFEHMYEKKRLAPCD